MISKVTTTIYEADDKSEWTTEEECIKRDQELDAVDKAMALIIARPKAHFWNGYIQHTPESVEACLCALLELVKRDKPLYAERVRQLEHYEVDEGDYYRSKFLLFDMGARRTPLGFAYDRFNAFIDGDLREWSRRDFCHYKGVTHPSVGKPQYVCINDTLGETK